MNALLSRLIVSLARPLPSFSSSGAAAYLSRLSPPAARGARYRSAMSRCPRGEGGWCAGTLTVPRTRAYGLCAFTFALGACTAALSTVLALRPGEHGCVPESRTPGRSAPGSPELCPEGWLTFLDRCFYLSTAVAGWEDARNYCLRHDADLIRPQTTAELVRARPSPPSRAVPAPSPHPPTPPTPDSPSRSPPRPRYSWCRA